MALGEGLWEGVRETSPNSERILWKSMKNPKNPEYLGKSLKTIPLRGPLRNPIGGRFPSLGTSQALAHHLVGVLRGNTIIDSTTLHSESKLTLWAGLWYDIPKTYPNRQTSHENLWNCLKTPKSHEYIWKPPSGILSEADFPVRTSQACRPYSCCPLFFFLPLPYPTPAKTKPSIISHFYWPDDTATVYLVWLDLLQRTIRSYQHIRTHW